MSGITDLLYSLMESAIRGFDSAVIDAANVLTDPASAWSSVVALSNILKPFCYMIIGLCLLIELAQVASKVDIIKWEHGLKVMVKMALAKVCIDSFAPAFLEACYAQATAWITAFSITYTPLGDDAMLEEIHEMITRVNGIWSVLGLLVSLILVIIAIKICGLLILVIAYGRMFELYVYVAVSPLPCAFFPLGDGSGGGYSRITAKFLKGFVAVCFQGVMMVVCITVFNSIMGSVLNNMIAEALVNADASVGVSDLAFTMLMGGLALVMSITKCGSWAKSIVDAM